MSAALGTARFPRRPWLDGRFAHVALGDFPTPVERVRGLLPRGVELWCKREDRAGRRYGGNKVRKLELLLGDALARGKERVVTIGGWGSNHALATAIYARALGLGCELRLFPQPDGDAVRAKRRACEASGAEVHATGWLGFAAGALRARLAPEVAYLAGGGSSPLGTLGWVLAADEIAAQVERGELPRVDAIYVALGSGGTAAGLLAGFRGDTRAPEIVAVRVVPRPVAGYGPTRALEERVLALLGGQDAAPARLRVGHGQLGRGYGHPTPAAEEAVRRAADHGLALETTYTGKALAQLLADAARGVLDGKRVLFVNTYAALSPA